MVLTRRTKLRVSKFVFGGYLFVFVEYLCNRSPKVQTKNIKNYSSISAIVNHRNWLDESPEVESRTRLEAKDTQKNQRPRPRTGMLEAKAKDQGHKRKCFPTKKGLKKFFSVDLQKNGLEKHFSADLQNFNHSKNSAVLELRTGQFSRT